VKIDRNSAVFLGFRRGALDIAVVIILSLVTQSVNASTLDEIRASGVLRVAAEPGTPPMLFENGSRYDGFDWQIARAIARSIGVPSVVIVPGKYSELPGRLLAGRADLIISGYTADEELTDLSWSDSYYDYGLCLVVRSDSDIQSIDDLAGRVVGIFNDPAAEEEVSKLLPYAERIEKFEDGYFDLLQSKEIDAFIYDYPYAQEEVKPYGDKLKIVQFNLTKSSYSVGIRAEDRDLLTEVNKAIQMLKGSTAYGTFVRRYLGGAGPVKIAAQKVQPSQRVYRVKTGDSLSRIAATELGDVNRWREIWEVNRGIVADPNLISAGWEILLPARK
jgi:ABC-type amino acid transport substrate-binding protein